MNKPLLLAKSALKKEELDAKMYLHAEGIEIQLLEEFNTMTAKELFKKNRDLFMTYPIKAIHAPLMMSREVVLESVHDSKFTKYTCELAELCGKYRNDTITVILHIATSVSQLEAHNRLEQLVTSIRKLADKYEHIRIGIENTTILNISNNNLNFETDSSCSIIDGKIHAANVDFVNIVDHPKVGCVIDFCHLLMTDRALNILLKWAQRGDLVQDKLVLDIIRQAAPKTILYHLAYPKADGYNSPKETKHGMPFHKDNDKEMELLQMFFMCYRNVHGYSNNVPITLEVYENDYTNCKNFRVTKEAVEQLL